MLKIISLVVVRDFFLTRDKIRHFIGYKKFELMLTRRAKAYSSSCSQ